MARLFALVAVVAIAGLGYYYFFHPPVVLKRHTEHALLAFAETIATKDRTKISEHLRGLLADNAAVQLEVGLFSFPQQETKQVMKQDFTKQDFVTFIDNTLYSLTDYEHHPELQSFALGEDGKTAAVTFSSKEYADGISYYAGTAVQMRFSSDTACNATVHFEKDQPIIDMLSCAMQLRMVPKPGEAQKIQQSPEALRQLLR